ncbi:MAG: DUF58 domain-containing protein [Sphingobacterium sp.]
MQSVRNLYIHSLFFYGVLLLAACFMLSFFVKALFLPSTILFWLFLAAWVWDLVFLYGSKRGIELRRDYPEKLSNGDQNVMAISLVSHYPSKVRVRVLEEFPEQLQLRNVQFRLFLVAHESKRLSYQIRPTKRGVYTFQRCHVLVKYLGFFERKCSLKEHIDIACFPSFIQLRKYQLLATTDRLVELGMKRIRRIGSTFEFEHIREYVRGDEYRHLNWKATAKHKKLLVNQYQEERSQPVYALIDTGRVMRMPFNGLTLLDYAINASLVLANTVILKHDRAGMLTYSSEVANHIPAERRNNQMMLISEKLYNIRTDYQESEFGNLYGFTQKYINKRSLLMMYTNFETLDALSRQLPYLRMIAKTHVLLVVVFQNVELMDLAKKEGTKTFDVYNQIIAQKLTHEKYQVVQELLRCGIQTLYTSPEHLTINSINKYLEIKARGLL